MMSRVPSYEGHDIKYWFRMAQVTYNEDPALVTKAFKGMGPSAIPFLTGRLREEGSWETRLYWKAWSRLPDKIRKHVPPPQGASSAPERAEAAELLGMFTSNRPAAIPPLIRALEDPEGSVRQSAAKSLGEAKVRFDLVTSALAKSLGDWLHPYAVRGLANACLGSDKVLPMLHEYLSSTNAQVRAGTAEALGLAGPVAKSLVPKLAEMTDAAKEPDKQARYAAAGALWKIEGRADAIIPFRVEAMHDRDVEVRTNAIGCLGEYGPLAKSAVTVLRAALSDTNEAVKASATEALKKIEGGGDGR
jgi:HEAT repeat protein